MRDAFTRSMIPILNDGSNRNLFELWKCGVATGFRPLVDHTSARRLVIERVWIGTGERLTGVSACLRPQAS